MQSRRSLGQRLIETNGRPTGFDYLRLFLAVGVVLWHSVAICYGRVGAQAFVSGPARAIVALILPMFFALSGFLVAGSLERCKSLISFLGLRSIRIFPALGVEVVLSACLLGPILTTFPLGRYFSDPEFHQYFLNIIGHIHFVLPGLFNDNPFPGIVNGQLWTVPFELKCYIAIALLAIVGLMRWRAVIWVGVFALVAVQIYKMVHPAPGVVPTVGALAGPGLVNSFLLGIAMFLYRDRLPFNPILGWASIAFAMLLLDLPGGDVLAPLPAAYATVWLGLMNPRKIGLLRGADYSYGVFLYGFVIQQTVIQILPWSRHWYANFSISILLAFALAAFSWHLIEKPALKLRKPLMSIEAWVLARLNGTKLSKIGRVGIASSPTQRSTIGA